jgi:hypothetical protein
LFLTSIYLKLLSNVMHCYKKRTTVMRIRNTSPKLFIVCNLLKKFKIIYSCVISGVYLAITFRYFQTSPVISSFVTFDSPSKQFHIREVLLNRLLSQYPLAMFFLLSSNGVEVLNSQSIFSSNSPRFRLLAIMS